MPTYMYKYSKTEINHYVDPYNYDNMKYADFPTKTAQFAWFLHNLYDIIITQQKLKNGLATTGWFICDETHTLIQTLWFATFLNVCWTIFKRIVGFLYRLRL